MTRTDRSGRIQKRSDRTTNADTLKSLLTGPMKLEIMRAVPRHMDPERMARMMVTCLTTTPKLVECSVPSVIGCMLQCSVLGLEPNTAKQEMYLIPRWNSKQRITECTMIVGYQGYIAMSMRSGLLSRVQGHVVREGDNFTYELGMEPRLGHKPSLENTGSRPVTHAYAVAKQKDGEYLLEVLSVDELHSRRAKSESYTGKFPQYSPWNTSYEAMCRKSAIRALWKWMPKTDLIATADAVEVAVDSHKSLGEALDSQVTDSLERKGLSLGADEEYSSDQEGTVENEPPAPEPPPEPELEEDPFPDPE